jgi:hypothetical protein
MGNTTLYTTPEEASGQLPVRYGVEVWWCARMTVEDMTSLLTGLLESRREQMTLKGLCIR